MNSNEYMLQLHKRILEKTYGTPPRQVGENTAAAYIKTLYNLNGKKPFKNLAFLKKTDEIMKKIAEYADSTQKTLVSSLASVLSLEKDKGGYKKAYKFYYDKMMSKAKEAKEVDTSEKTTKQEENWLTWDEVKKRYTELKDATANIKKPSTDDLLSLLVLGLYVEVPPRRNQDYLHMKVIKTRADKFATPLNTFKDDNFLVIRKGVPVEFVFNKYKTSKTYGTQTISIPTELSEIIKRYVKAHPENKSKEFHLLVGADGTHITADNSITRILNRVFGKNVGSSMLRHIYLSSKYDVTTMSNDAEAMAHSLNQQKEYLKGSSPLVEPPSPQSDAVSQSQ